MKNKNYFRETNKFSSLLFKLVTSYTSPNIFYLSPLAGTFEAYLNERLNITRCPEPLPISQGLVLQKLQP